MAGLALKKTNLAEQAYGVILELLLEGGRYRPGDKISVEALTRELAVSRSPVWAAINRLAAEGMVEVRPRDGVFFTGFDRRRLAELFAVREELESMAARLAAARGLAAEDDAALRASLERQRQAVASGDAGAYGREAAVFHDLLARASGNSVLAGLLGTLFARIRGMCAAADRPAGTLERHIEAHAAVLAAVTRRDAAMAEQTVRAHVAALAEGVGASAEGRNQTE